MKTQTKKIVIWTGFVIHVFASILNGYSASWDNYFSSDYPGSNGLTTAIAITTDFRDEVFVAELISDSPTTTVIHRWHKKKEWDYDGSPMLQVDGIVYALTYYSGKLYVGGLFTGIAHYGSAPIPANSVAVYGVFTGGDLQALGSGVTSSGGAIARVHTIAVDHSTGGSPWVYVGGRFTSPYTNVARWNGSQWLDLNGGVSDGAYWPTQPVNSIAVIRNPDNYHDVYVGGCFVKAPTGGTGDGYNLAKWSQSDNNWRAFGHGISHFGWNNDCSQSFYPSTALVTGMTVHTNGGTKTIRIIGDFSAAGYDFFSCQACDNLSTFNLGAATLDHVSSSLLKWAKPDPSIGIASVDYVPYFTGKVTSHNTGLYIAGAVPTSIWPFDCNAIQPITGENILLWQDNNEVWHDVGGGFLSTDSCVDLKSSNRLGVFLAGTFGVKRYQP